MASASFVFTGAAGCDHWSHPLKRDYVRGSAGRVFVNTGGQQIERTLVSFGEVCGTRFDFECCVVGHPYALSHLRGNSPVTCPSSGRAPSAYSAESDRIQHASITWRGSPTRPSTQTNIPRALARRQASVPVRLDVCAVFRARASGTRRQPVHQPGERAKDNARQVEKTLRSSTRRDDRSRPPPRCGAILGLKGADSIKFRTLQRRPLSERPYESNV